MHKRPWTVSLPRYWPAERGTPLGECEEVASALLDAVWPKGMAGSESRPSIMASPSGRTLENIYQGDQHPLVLLLFFFLFLSKFCQPQIHLSVFFSPLFLFFFVLELVSLFLSSNTTSRLIHLHNLHTVNYTIKPSQLPVSLRRDNFFYTTIFCIASVFFFTPHEHQ